MNLPKEIEALVQAGVITEETAQNIRDFYRNKKNDSGNRLFIVFGILGAILVGLGLMLIIAHNWDELSRSLKTTISFMPVIAGQILCGYIIFSKSESTAWRESGTAFLFIAVGACISLITQIYNIPGDTSSFVLLWMLLCMPLIYVMRSSLASLMFIAGITFYTLIRNHWFDAISSSYYYWVLLLAIIPHYTVLLRKKRLSNFTTMHNWFLAISILLALNTIGGDASEFMTVSYFSVFAIYIFIGSGDLFKEQKPGSNSYLILGMAGSVILLLVLSFDWFWDNLRDEHLIALRHNIPELISASVFTLAATILLIRKYNGNNFKEIHPFQIIYLLFLPIFLVGFFSPVAVVLINLVVFATGILTIRSGAIKDNLGIINLGLIIISALITCRFFDRDLTFIARGILFVIVGTGFFITNYVMIKKRKAHE